MSRLADENPVNGRGFGGDRLGHKRYIAIGPKVSTPKWAMGVMRVHDMVCKVLRESQATVAEFARIPVHERATANRNSGEFRYEPIQTVSYTRVMG